MQSFFQVVDSLYSSLETRVHSTSKRARSQASKRLIRKLKLDFARRFPNALPFGSLATPLYETIIIHVTICSNDLLFLFYSQAAVNVRLCTDVCDRTRYQLEHAVCLISLRSIDHPSRNGSRLRHGGHTRLLSTRVAVVVLISSWTLIRIRKMMRSNRLLGLRTCNRTMAMLWTSSWMDTRRKSRLLCGRRRRSNE
jgi:hypothetical protein